MAWISIPSVLTTVGSDVFDKGCYSNISGSRGVLELSHQLVKLDLCLCVMPSLLIFLYLFQRDFIREGDYHQRWFFKWYLNRNPCSFPVLFISYLCALSIFKQYRCNICILNGVPTTCRNSSLLFSCCFVLPGVRLCYVTVTFRNTDAAARGPWS